MRRTKTVGSTAYKYYYDGNLLTHMTKGSSYIHIYYDANGNPISMYYSPDGGTYYYLQNPQGDVIGLVDSSGNLVVEYYYDAWGKSVGTAGSKASTVGAMNPLRYRGYIYDTETGLFYVCSRYYNPEVGRFINADSQLNPGLLGGNQFAYCENNPVFRTDSTGKWFGFDDVITGPTDELIILGILVFAAYCGSDWAEKTSQRLFDEIDDLFDKPFNTSTEKHLPDIAGKYENGQCDTAAKAMEKYLNKKGEDYKVKTITFINGNGIVWGETYNVMVGNNGFHMGIEYNGKVYCNIHPYGLPIEIWENDFVGTGIKIVN